MILLDTCALLWLAQGDGALSPKAESLIDSEPVVYLSAISGFEIGIKYVKGKLHLPVPPVEWLRTVIRHHDLHVLPLDIETCAASTALPTIHTDPCDRMIIACAKINNLTVITGDDLFKQYGIETLV